jgi:exodeoxyribonuclease VII small subunit
VARDKTSSKGPYGDVVDRLTEIVQALEAGELSLEESLERFAEGVKLVKEGEALLSDAEKRIEQLLSDDGKTAPLKLADTKEVAVPPASASARGAKRPVATPPPPAPPRSDDDLDDVPF